MKRRRMHSVKPALLLVLAALLLAAACGGKSVEKPRQAAGQPPGPPPTHARGAPPPAWAETQHDSHWLAYSSYCWSGTGRAQCADFVTPSCSDPRIPKIEVQQGEMIRFHLGFEPSKVEVTAGSASATLPTGREPVWRASDDGPMTLSSHAGGDSAGYTACLQFMRQTNGINIHPSEQ